MSSPVKPLSSLSESDRQAAARMVGQSHVDRILRQLGYTGPTGRGEGAAWLDEDATGTRGRQFWDAVGDRQTAILGWEGLTQDARNRIAVDLSGGIVTEARNNALGNWLDADTTGYRWGQWSEMVRGGGKAFDPAGSKAFDSAAASAAEDERRLATRRRGRGAMLLTGGAGLDPAEGTGSVARRLLTGVAA